MINSAAVETMADTYSSKMSLGDLRVKAIKITATQIKTIVAKIDAYFITSYYSTQEKGLHFIYRQERQRTV